MGRFLDISVAQSLATLADVLRYGLNQGPLTYAAKPCGRQNANRIGYSVFGYGRIRNGGISGAGEDGKRVPSRVAGPARTFLNQREFRNTTTSANATIFRRRPPKRRPSPRLRPQQPHLPRSSRRLSRSRLRSRPATPRPRPPPSPKSPRPQAARRHEMNSTASWRTSSIVPPTKATRNWCRARHRPR
jgi:hypothetical protein